MARIRTWALLCSGCLLFCHAASAAESIPPSERLLPNTTKAYVAVADVQRLIDQWKRTQLGQLMSDPVMEPVAEDLRKQIEERLAGTRDRLGLTLDDLKDVAAGEVAVGAILLAPDRKDAAKEAAEGTTPPAPGKPALLGKPALAVVVDVTGNLPRAAELLKKVSEVMIERGAKRSLFDVDESPDPVVLFDIPKPKGNPEGKARKAYYCLTGNLLAASDNLEVARGILARLRTDRGDSLADLASFQAVFARCAKDAGAIRPQIRWFVEPLGYGELIRAATAEAKRRKGTPRITILRNQGFGAIQAVGGHVDLASEGYEMVHRTAVHARPPYEKAMKMLAFPAGKDFTPQPWVPRGVATYATGYCDVLEAFDNFGSLFDELVGGEEGVWQDTLESFKAKDYGPQIDLRADIAARLDRRITVITDQQLPVTPTSERLLLAIAIKAGQEKDLAEAMKKLMSNERNTVRRELEGRSVVWETVEEEQVIDVPNVSVNAIPSLVPPDEEEDWEEAEPLLPHSAVTVTRGHLFVASHIDFLVKVLKVAKERDTLGRSLDYHFVDDKAGRAGLGSQCFRSFSRTDQDYRATYELIRKGTMPLSESVLGRLLNAVLGEQKEGVVRAPKIDGSKLPEFDVVRRYLGPAGMVVTTEPDGWFFKGFTLNKEAP